jgi:hypothetical protein
MQLRSDHQLEEFLAAADAPTESDSEEESSGAPAAPFADAPVAPSPVPGIRVVTAAASEAPVAPSPIPGIRVVTSAGSNGSVASAPVASAPGNRFKMSARPLLEHFDINYLDAKFGINALDTIKIERIQGGPNHDKFVAHDTVAQLLEMDGSNANRKVKRIVVPVPEPCNDKQREENRKKEENFPSCTLLMGSHVSLVHVLT